MTVASLRNMFEDRRFVGMHEEGRAAGNVFIIF